MKRYVLVETSQTKDGIPYLVSRVVALMMGARPGSDVAVFESLEMARLAASSGVDDDGERYLPPSMSILEVDVPAVRVREVEVVTAKPTFEQGAGRGVLAEGP